MSTYQDYCTDELKAETREAMQTLIENGETVISNQDAVSSQAVANELGVLRKTAAKRLRVDPKVKEIDAIDPETINPTTAYTLQ